MPSNWAHLCVGAPRLHAGGLVGLANVASLELGPQMPVKVSCWI